MFYIHHTAADHLKRSANIALATSVLAWGVIEFKEAYMAGGAMSDILDCIRWPLEYMIKYHVAPNEFYGMVG